MQQSSTGDVNMREMGQGPLIDRLKGAAQKSKQEEEEEGRCEEVWKLGFVVLDHHLTDN